jgi:pyruvate kinase
MIKTKIVCTLGPATDNIETLKDLIKAGMSVARLNFSHGSHEEHKVRVDMFRQAVKELGVPVGLLLDTKGPEIRLRKFEKGEVELKTGDSFTLTIDEVVGTEEIVSVSYKGLPGDIEKGSRILIADGLVELKVTSKTDKNIDCVVINGGAIGDNKGVNVPGATISMPFLSERDKLDLKFSVDNDFDFIAASFVRGPNDIKDMKKLLDDFGGGFIKIIAKIENRDGVRNIDDIVHISDGVMVARGDMGVEIPFEELPSIQKDIIKKCGIAGIPAITATQMLDSMIRNPRPTRAEITDVANAIYDGTSALMLSGETSIGKYPVDTVKVMAKIAAKTESDIDYIKRFNNTHITVSRNITNAISQATCETAHSLGAAAILSLTKSGHTARMVSKYRPACPIIAMTVLPKVYNQLSLSWGVFPVLTEEKYTTEEIFEQSIIKAEETDLIKNGDLIVITGGFPAGISGATNTLRVHIVGDVLLEGTGLNKLSSSGTICVIADGENDILDFKAGDILVFSKATEKILHAIKNASAIITEEDSENSKGVIVGLALDIPVISNAMNATGVLKSGTVVTVDASKGIISSGLK